MAWRLHRIAEGEVFGHRRGLFVERWQGRVCSLHLLVSFVGRGVRAWDADFGRSVIHGRPMYWARLELRRQDTGRWRLELHRGVTCEDLGT